MNLVYLTPYECWEIAKLLVLFCVLNNCSRIFFTPADSGRLPHRQSRVIFTVMASLLVPVGTEEKDRVLRFLKGESQRG